MGTIFYKYKQINPFLFESLEQKYFYFSSPSELNDPFDCLIPNDLTATDSEIKTWIKRFNVSNITVEDIRAKFTQDTFHEFIEKANEINRQRYNIFCLSRKWNESLMWGLYADSGKGICIGYNTLFINNAYVLQIEKQNKKNVFFIDDNQDYYYAVLLKVKYDRTNTKPYNPIKQNIAAIKEGLLHKEPKWMSEEEYRTFLFNTELDSKQFIKKIYYRENILKEIIFGINTPQTDIDKVKMIITRNYKRDVSFYRIKENIKNMSLDRIKI